VRFAIVGCGRALGKGPIVLITGRRFRKIPVDGAESSLVRLNKHYRWGGGGKALDFRCLFSYVFCIYRAVIIPSCDVLIKSLYDYTNIPAYHAMLRVPEPHAYLSVLSTN